MSVPENIVPRAVRTLTLLACVVVLDGSGGAAPVAATKPTPFAAGIVAGSAARWELPYVRRLRAPNVRLAFPVDTPVSAMAADMRAYARARIRPLLLADFTGRRPSPRQARNLGRWAAAYGPGGSFWREHHLPDVAAPTRIELGNETSYSHQYPTLAGRPDWARQPSYLRVAADYARTARSAALAIRAANPRVGLLLIGDQPGGWTTWMDGLFATVPELKGLIAGWTIHPYGPNWRQRVDDTLRAAGRHGAARLPLWVTEFGVSADRGRCLSDNYGWNRCMRPAQAASALTRSVAAMRRRYGRQLAGVFVYQAHDQRVSGSSRDREAYFGALTFKGRSKGALTDAVMRLLAG